MDDSADEETALLMASSRSGDQRQGATTPLPKLQISILLLLQLSESITSKSIHPFINQLVGTLDITGGDERKVGYYVGLIESLFFATHSITVLPWSRLSDHVGRKPIILTGVFAISASMVCFGLSRTFWGLVASRCLSGLLNGNSGVIKAFMGEVTDKSNMAQGFAFIFIIWCVGGTIGPLLGGSLSRPHDRFPRYFSGQFWKTYPYFLPCVASGSISAVAFFVGLLFLKETVHGRKAPANLQAVGTIIAQNGSVEGQSIFPPNPKQRKEDPVRLHEFLVFPVLISITNYVLLSFLDTSKAALQPLFLSTPIEFGGLGLSPPSIGLVLGLYGLADGILQALLFPVAVRWWGPKRVFFWAMVALLPAYALFPVMSVLARHGGLSPLVWTALVVQIILSVIVDMGYGCVFMFVTSAAPNRRSLGTMNGLCQTIVSIAHAAGPAVSTSLFAFSVQRDRLGGYGVYAVFVGLTCCSLLVAGRLPDDLWTMEGEE